MSHEWKAFAKADEVDGPHGWIQWKGTDACIDIHCSCGEDSHIDGEFLYYIQCPHCEQIYQTGMNVKLHPVDRIEKDFTVYIATP